MAKSREVQTPVEQGPSRGKKAVQRAGSSGPDDALASRIRELLSERVDVEEKRMFGGLCFMVNGQMCCGLTKTDLMVRVGKAGYDDALAQPHARPMDFTGRPLVGFVYVDPAGVRTKVGLAKWIARGLAFVTTSPPPQKKKRPAAQHARRG